MNTNSEAITALYCRLSCDDDTEGESLSIENQKKLLTQYADEKGFFNTRFYVDDGISGTTFERDGFKRMMSDVQSGEVKTVIVKDMSRFGRDYIQVGLYTEILFPQNNVRFIAINDSYDSINGSDDFIPFKNIMNEWYAKDTSKKIKAVLTSKGNAGEHLASVPPYGYVKNPENKKEWIIDEVAAPIVAEIFRLFIGGASATNIAQSLAERGVLTPTAHKQRYGIVATKSPIDNKKMCLWSSFTVAEIIDNEAYTGTTVSFKTHGISYKVKKRVQNDASERKVFENTHPAIVDKETWKLAQGLRRKRRRPTQMGEMNMLSGYLFCAACGARMTLMRAVNKRYEYFYCGAYRAYSSHKSCTSHIVRADVVEQLILAHIQAVTGFAKQYEDEFVKLISSSANTEQSKQIKVLNKSIAKANKRLTELETLIANLYEDKVSGEITAEMFNQLSKKFTDEQSELRQSAKVQTEQLNEINEHKASTDKFLDTVKKYTEITELTPEILAEFIDKVVVHQADKSTGKRTQQIDIYFKGVGKVEL